MSEIKLCKNCKYASEKYNYDNYLCKRHSPIAVKSEYMGVDFKPVWPEMTGSDWCGDFEEAK